MRSRHLGPHKGITINYASSITAEAQEDIPTDAAAMRGAPGTSSRTRTVLIAGGGLLALLLAIPAYFALAGGEPVAPADDSAGAPVVTVILPGKTSVSGMIEAPGTIAARRPMPVGVVGEGGQVLRVLVDAGDWVRQGQVLAVIDRSVQTQQAVAQAAQIEVSRADARLAQANLDRALQLVEPGFISKADVDRLTATRDAAAARP